MRMIFFVLALAPLISFSQVVLPKNNEGKIDYSEVVKLDSLGSAALYSKAKLFIADAFKSGKDVMQVDDRDTKTVVAKGLIPVEAKGFAYVLKMNVRFKTMIQAKDGRYKYSFTDFIGEYSSDSGTSEYPLDGDRPRGLTKKNWEDIQRQVDESIVLMVADLKKQMASTKGSDW